MAVICEIHQNKKFLETDPARLCRSGGLLVPAYF
jgi:hypothetical protein